jgi:hypothetical protein
MGGRRRRRGSRRASKRKTMRGGMYGFGGALNGTTAGPQWNNMGNPEVNPATGGVVPESILGSQGGGRRRRRTAKGKKVSRKGGRRGRRTTRRRAMRGGAPMLNAPMSNASFGGEGYGGLPVYVDSPSNVGGRAAAADGVIPSS